MFKEWNEEDHPRDEIGRFTFKGMGSSSAKNSSSKERIVSGISLPNIDWGSLKEILFKVLGEYVTPALALYGTVSQFIKLIKKHNLEDKLEQTIETYNKNNNNKGEQENSQENTDKTAYSDKHKVKENGNNSEQKGHNEGSKEYKNRLLNVLGDKATQADILYATPKQLEEKIREYGLDKKNSQMKENYNNVKLSNDTIKKAREFIQGNEGYRGTAYQDKAGIWTIGYGHTGYIDGKPITQGMKITKEKAEELYKKDFESHVVPLKDIKTPLSKNQKIALASFIYNFGVGAFNNSELKKKIEAGDIKSAANEFDKWIYIKNKTTGKKEVSQGLINRRKREKDLFLKPDNK